ncbi:cofilin/actin-depolymerizing factor homolog [Pocillopora verrucosa]|uniref:cofilin/actin-depolymerizing factor homolog n=1 Tax=Pocillopora verrucosa TaxID=203993 RepID=UPI003342B7FB
MSSGVEVDQAVMDAFNDIKLKKRHAYVVMMIKDKKKIVVETLGDKLPLNCSESRNEDIFNSMKKSFGNEPRYILFDFCFTRPNHTTAQKLALISWCNDDVAIGKKMIYASSKDALKKCFTGLNIEFQCTDPTEFQHAELVKEMIHKDRV